MRIAIFAVSGGSSLDRSRAQDGRRLLLGVLGLAAALNLIAGAVVASWPERQSDLETIQRWGRMWLFEGVDVFTSSEVEMPDYPPHALVLLSPLSVLTLHSGVIVWASVNLALLPITAYLAIEHVSPRASPAAAAIPILLFLCWSGSRTLLQFSLLSLTFGLLASVLSLRRPVLSGMCLAASLMKPQIAAPVFVWLLLARRWKVVSIGLAGVLFGFAVYCARVGASPLQVGARYADILRHYYTGEAVMVGVAQLRPLFEASFADSRLVDLGVAISVVILLGVIAVVGYREREVDTRMMFTAPGLVAIWSLLTFHHLTNGFLILWPLAALLLLAPDPQTAILRRRLFWLLQVGLVFDATTLWRWFGQYTAVPGSIGSVVGHFDRFFLLAIFVAVAALASRTRRTVLVGH